MAKSSKKKTKASKKKVAKKKASKANSARLAQNLPKKKPQKKAKKKAKKVLITSKSEARKLRSASVHDIWPGERELIEKPERLKYVRKLVKPKGCVFCKAAKRGVSFESLCLYKDDKAMVVLNKYPYNNGHLLVLPVQHNGEMDRLDEDIYLRVTKLLRRASAIVKEAYECEALNVGLNQGSMAGAGIPDHLHFHLIPRWRGDTNFFPLIADTKVVIETLEQSYARLIPYFEKLKL